MKCSCSHSKKQHGEDGSCIVESCSCYQFKASYQPRDKVVRDESIGVGKPVVLKSDARGVYVGLLGVKRHEDGSKSFIHGVELNSQPKIAQPVSESEFQFIQQGQ